MAAVCLKLLQLQGSGFYNSLNLLESHYNKKGISFKGRKIVRKIPIAMAILFIFLLMSFDSPTPVGAADTEPFAGEPLCLPGIYPQSPAECLALGPSNFLSSMAAKGIPIPLQPLPVYSPDPNLMYSELPYIKVGDNAFPLYASLDAAIARNPASMLEAGMKYLAILD